MAKKFYDIDEAATVLGVTPAQLNEMRTRNEIRGFRDGTTWKFRPEDVDEVAAELKAKGGLPPTDDSIGIGSHPTDESEGGSVLLSERELGSGPTTSSTIIGKSPSGIVDSDIKLSEPPRDKVDLAGMSDVKLAGGSDVLREGRGPEGGSDIGMQFEELDSLELDFNDSGKVGSGSKSGSKPKQESPSKGGSGRPASDKGSKGIDSGLSLAEDDLAMSDGGSRKPAASDIGGSAIDLSGDDDLVLGGSGSDVTTKPGDSGISLMDPSDSGLSLDEPLELGGSTVEGGSLVLGEDDMITLGGDVDTSGSTQLRSDDDFLLTPASAAGDESESGSQVIALDSVEGFDEEGATQVAGGPVAMRLLEEDIQGADTIVGGPALMPVGAGMPGAQPGAGGLMAPAIPEAPYSIWNVLALFVCVSLLCMIGMMMFDMMRNIWSWDKSYPINSSLMDALIDMFSKKK